MGGLKRDPRGRPIFIELPRRVEIMEAASTRAWEALKRLSLDQLKSLRPTGPFVPLIDALIDIRLLMGEDLPTANEIDALERHRRSVM
jgi:hypothetical protein